MSKLEEYIEELKNKIKEIPEMSELKIMRYIYIDLGKKINFDLNYVFGNRKTKEKIYNKLIDENELNNILGSKTSICKGLSILYARILIEFGINAKVIVEEESYSNKYNKHVYNLVVLKNNQECYVDIEDDLQYIQSGSKTTMFAIDRKNKKPVISDDVLKKWDIENKYIPEGYYLEDMLELLKKAVSNKNITLEEKLKVVLDNLNVYRDNKSVEYRETFLYHKNMLETIFKPSEMKKINLIRTVEENNDNKNYKTCIYLNEKGKNHKIYLYSDKENKYKQLSEEELSNQIKDGMILLDKIPRELESKIFEKIRKIEKDDKEK